MFNETTDRTHLVWIRKKKTICRMTGIKVKYVRLKIRLSDLETNDSVMALSDNKDAKGDSGRCMGMAKTSTTTLLGQVDCIEENKFTVQYPARMLKKKKLK